MSIDNIYDNLVRGLLILSSLAGLGMVLIVLLSVFQRRSEEHTSELQSLVNLVCRLLLEKKKELLDECLL